MTNKTELIKIVDYLIARPLANRKDIAKAVGEIWHSGKFVAMLETLSDYELIRSTKTDVYKITSKGEKFESFNKLEEDESWQIKLAKSNIESNELQKKIAEENAKKEKRNEIATWINVAVGLINLAIIIWQ